MTCSKGTLSAFGLDANIHSICCSTGQFLSDFVKVVMTAILSVATFVDCSRHRRSLANNTGGGGGQNGPWELGAKLERGVRLLRPVLNIHITVSPTLIPVILSCVISVVY
jgi:hypothetical protein